MKGSKYRGLFSYRKLKKKDKNQQQKREKKTQNELFDLNSVNIFLPLKYKSLIIITLERKKNIYKRRL